MIPVSREITVPFTNHRFIIGQKGAGIRKMMEEFDVNISVPPLEREENIIVVTGPIKHVEKALEALRLRNEEVEAGNEDRKLRNFEMTVEVAAKYHSKIIGNNLLFGLMLIALRRKAKMNVNLLTKTQC